MIDLSLFPNLFNKYNKNISTHVGSSIYKRVTMTRKCSKHRPQTNPRYYEEETHTTDNFKTIEVKQQAPSVSEHII